MKNPENESGAAVLQRLDEQLNKYRFMDANLQQKKKRLMMYASTIINMYSEWCSLYIMHISLPNEIYGRILLHCRNIQ